MRTPRRALIVLAGACAASAVSAAAVAQEGGRAVFTGRAPWLAFLIAVGALVVVIGVVAMAGRGVGPAAVLTPDERTEAGATEADVTEASETENDTPQDDTAGTNTEETAPNPS